MGCYINGVHVFMGLYKAGSIERSNQFPPHVLSRSICHGCGFFTSLGKYSDVMHIHKVG